MGTTVAGVGASAQLPPSRPSPRRPSAPSVHPAPNARRRGGCTDPVARGRPRQGLASGAPPAERGSCTSRKAAAKPHGGDGEGGLPETYVPPGRDGEPGVYLSADPAAASRRLLAATPGLLSWGAWYRAPWWLQQGDLMTLAAALARRPLEVDYDRQLLATPDGGVLALDVVRPAASQVAPSPMGVQAPYVLLVAGLGGGSQGTYVRRLAVALTSRGFAVAVLNMRGCGGAPLRTARMFSAHRGATDDVRVAISHLRKTQLRSPGARESSVFLVGWSVGGSIVTNALADQVSKDGKCHDGRWTRADGGAVLCAPLDQVKASAQTEERFVSRYLYSATVARNIVRQLEPHAELYRSGPVARWVDGKTVVDVDADLLFSATRIYDIDEALTRRVFGYQSVCEYYRAATCFRRLTSVDKPLLLVQAADDPICSGWVPTQEVRRNPNIALAYTAHGGHLGWQDEADFTECQWVERVVVDFLGAVTQLGGSAEA